ncbi:alpha/beta hydrolase [Ktedonosporobacter rubrisoli]|uniref:Alpha/beta hydrolase n=1 Tax=Ktedonosporobacter rubrisoli TaxID=2509675 RepID=A0A4P6K5P7_KTERU|nr:alpha/beta hydrolase [Ktedonosporobacter rubrisoli]QBD83303.1 alpha/beta hydrolase [Ktedonosporobacter rubrisoli]
MSGQLIQRIIVDQNVFELCSSGIGSPTIILDAGLRVNLDTWSTIFDRLAALTTTFCYNRLGVGGSGPVAPSLTTRATRRTSEQMAQELHTLLFQADVRPPYLLIGHSLGD